MYTIESQTQPITFLCQGASRWGALPFVPVTSPTALFQIKAITNARRTIFIQTPNLNSRALLKALKNALLNKVAVILYLPKNMMVLESIIIGWSTTKCCVSLLQRWAKRNHANLEVHWFQSDPAQTFVVDHEKSHIKFMVVDEELVIFGSSNLDRASAMTSGEVNIAIPNPEFARSILATVKRHQLTSTLEV